jgi:antitoxin MazE
MKTTAQVRKWGNSLAIRVPKRVAQDLGLSEDSLVEISSDGKTATIKPEASRPFSLDELVKGITPDNVHREVDWGKPVGNEIW